mmetsp:Transcript_23907/g.90366  ORF Transcript_23907/g.90366 Transcript_23907/m.90366 type:complete len:209 (+) Transcript_23907:299-925(+)
MPLPCTDGCTTIRSTLHVDGPAPEPAAVSSSKSSENFAISSSFVTPGTPIRHARLMRPCSSISSMPTSPPSGTTMKKATRGRLPSGPGPSATTPNKLLVGRFLRIVKLAANIWERARRRGSTSRCPKAKEYAGDSTNAAAASDAASGTRKPLILTKVPFPGLEAKTLSDGASGAGARSIISQATLPTATAAAAAAAPAVYHEALPVPA